MSNPQHDLTKPGSPSENPPKSDASGDNVDSSAPPSWTASESSDSTQPSTGKKKIDYPGGLWSVLAIGALMGVTVGPLLFRVQPFGIHFPRDFDARYWAGVFLAVILWLGGFACVGALLPGTTKQRLRRAAVMALLSVPAFILYAPIWLVSVLGVSLRVEPHWIGLVIGVVEVPLVITIAAIAVRAVTRRRLRRAASDRRSSESPPAHE